MVNKQIQSAPIAAPQKAITRWHIQIWYYFLSWAAALFVSVLAFFAANMFPTKGLSILGQFAITAFIGLSFLFVLLIAGVGIVVGLVLFITQAMWDFGRKKEDEEE